MARANGLVGMPVMTDEQRRNYLSRMARGEFIGCVAISEPDVGSDVSGIACRARRDGDSWVINGNKYWCTFADGADFMILMARTSEPTNPKRRHEAERVTSDALQLLGGAGYTTLHPVERFRRDARLTKIFEGTSEIQLRIISDRLLA
jgi:alkylation response protein AidB-like acyl-CoA dehydrogenase